MFLLRYLSFEITQHIFQTFLYIKKSDNKNIDKNKIEKKKRKYKCTIIKGQLLLF